MDTTLSIKKRGVCYRGNRKAGGAYYNFRPHVIFCSGVGDSDGSLNPPSPTTPILISIRGKRRIRKGLKC
ncbi:hypothetical protein XELAEV_18038354mg [Xenopus laevis]|uniref:Uncharacterized protein n=1 Tax=Xenopus laevis TaxID=8355 RepID=A0A974C5V9_XENLA|nr:hypothetical protein XELAEV_18038354mg [Xenopus laevis]